MNYEWEEEQKLRIIKFIREARRTVKNSLSHWHPSKPQKGKYIENTGEVDINSSN